ncbi:glutaredoxin family protein [Metabacillus endolithicus]|uniref:glutaredoxin family protein n=1 Tax=Metabacillus endolithicus TaxID=1535204 RepID=UPI003CD0D77B
MNEKSYSLYSTKLSAMSGGKEVLDHHQISYLEKDVSKDLDARNTLINELQSTSTPTVTVDDAVVTGFDLQKLEKLLEIEN